MKRLVCPTALLGLLLGLSVLADVVAGVSLALSWTLGMLLVGVGLGYARSQGAARAPRAVLLSTFALLILAMPWVEWNALKPFLRDLHAVQPGMDRRQVEALMGKYLRGTGFPALPHALTGGTLVVRGRTFATMPSTDGQLELADALVYRYAENADWGIVRFHEGRVVQVEFSPD